MIEQATENIFLVDVESKCIVESNAAFRESMGGDGPRATPTWHDGKVYALGGEGELRCLDAGTGNLLWRTILTHAIRIFLIAALDANLPALRMAAALVGIPPLAGFVGKFYLFGAAVRSGCHRAQSIAGGPDASWATSTTSRPRSPR